ncbi:hypothetical protein [Sedimentibacter saalensis]|uniref:dCMP deaminase n=1 Tax=Sedimentibacter saalensis TaxID=130788 RepID=A0A562JKZ7_9FIRM|nr:hypothetical protein [Sedimentibacter saalensis]TWH83633.1 dCMP deaminase [Sedimentibacter saalensis]
MLSELNSEAVEKLYSERKDFIIIGLTGRTGSGCSTVASLLSKTFEELQPTRPVNDGSNEKRQYEIIYNYSKVNWEPFKVIEMKNVIFTFVLENSLKDFNDYIHINFDPILDMSDISEEYEEMHKKRIKFLEETKKQTENGENVPADDDIYSFYFIEVPSFFEKFKRMIINTGNDDLYTRILQTIGDNIRASGNAFSNDIIPENVFKLPQRVNMLIKILRRRNIKEKKKILVVIDAFRNPFEVTFFKDRYSSFYLFSINSVDKERRERLQKINFTKAEIDKLDKKEYPNRNNLIEDYYKIDIEKTIEIADVHINNKNSATRSYSYTKEQVIRYISLIMHPGLVNPTKIEFCMQIACNSKLNSGCLSRQVGAVITDRDYNILSVGWNSAPSNQVPCNLRDLQSLIRNDKDDKVGMSVYERTNLEFKEFLKERTKDIDFKRLSGRMCSYCFKDAYNSFKKEKNQVYTRSIHAEEMAFLQVISLGSMGVKGGCLFTTASPCELCSKKACQTGIEKIYYIDQYPGISYEHILNCGSARPEMILFNGAIGSAYNHFYTQVLAYKDELYMLLNLNFKKKKKLRVYKINKEILK